MTHEDFLEAVKKGLGSVPNLEARPYLAELVLQKGFTIKMRYEWIQDKRFLAWCFYDERVDFRDGMDWIEIFVYEEHRST